MKKLLKFTASLLCSTLLFCWLPAANAAKQEAVKITSLKTAGFTVKNFSGNTKYYLCYPEDFKGIQFTEIKTNIKASVSIKVERYCDCDYQLSYKVKDELYLGYGRARVSVNVTSNSDKDNTATYLFALTDPKQDSYRYRYLKGTTTVYKTPAASSEQLAVLPKGTTFSSMPLCIESKDGWTKIVIPSYSTKYHGQVGWVKSEGLVEEYTKSSLPYSYKKQISALKKAYPNWTFEYRHMNTDIRSYAAKIASIYKRNTGKSVSLDTVLKNMDPKNFLDEESVFMFLDVTDYQSKQYTEQGITALWNEKAVINGNKADISEAQAVKYLLNAGKSLRVNSYFLAARAVLESGHGTSNLAKGMKGTDGKLYYNFYGIQAYDKDPNNGAVYAEKRCWDSPFRSIVEGANWIADQYIQRGQNTPYFFRYYPYQDHLYMSDLKAPQKDAANIRKCYSGADILKTGLHFIIPVFDGVVYKDVSEKDWYYEDVYRATEYGLFTGMENGNFQPEEALTRAQFVTVLAKISGADLSDYKGKTIFKDVSRKAWYAKYVEWAYKSGVSKGTGKTTFAPDQSISRQELCTMLASFATSKGIKMKDGKLNFTDKAAIAKWARHGVQKCVGSKLVSGMPGGAFAPEESATRAQGAVILSLFYENFMLSKK